MKPRLLMLVLCVSGILLFPIRVMPASQSISVNMAFDSTLMLTNKTDISFGIIKANQSGIYSISPSGSITVTNDGLWLGGSQNAGSLTIVGSTTQAIDINVNNYVANNGVTPSEAICSYNGGASSPCALSSQAPPGNGKLLLLGLTINVDGSQSVGSTAAPSFDVVVNYH